MGENREEGVETRRRGYEPQSRWRRVSGYPDLGDYQRWDWPATNWMHARLSGQLNFVDEGNAPEGTNEENRIDIQPTMTGYSIQLDESDIIYNVTHEEVLDDRFNPEWIIDQMLMARNVPAENRGEKFEDKRFSSYVMIMLGMTKIPGHTGGRGGHTWQVHCEFVESF